MIRQTLTCRKYGFPAIFLPHLHVRTTNACFLARETLPPFTADSDTPYSLTNHFAVGASISKSLSSSPCFLQNSSNDLSVTKVSTSRSWPAEIQACICATGTSRRSAARSQEYASSPFARAAAIPSMAEDSNDVRTVSQSSARELADMRGSRTLSIPLPMRYLSLAGLACNISRRPRSDHPSVTLALIPSAPSRKRTARSERPSRCAIFPPIYSLYLGCAPRDPQAPDVKGGAKLYQGSGVSVDRGSS